MADPTGRRRQRPVRRFERALVTGGSDGIGAAIATRLAARRSDLVLVARRRDRLEEVAAQLTADHGVDVEVLVADLADEAGIAAVEARLGRSGDVDLLVNAAAGASDGPLVERDPASLGPELTVNVVAPTRLTRAALGPMVAARRGAVLQVASLGAFQPVPGMATYGAAKAYLDAFSQAVHEEVRRHGVTATVLYPGYTRTGFASATGTTEQAAAVPALLWQDADEVAAAALAALDRGRATVVSGPINRVAAALTSTLPSAITRRMAAGMTGR